LSSDWNFRWRALGHTKQGGRELLIMVEEDVNVQIVHRLIATSTHVASYFELASYACIGCDSVGPLMWQVGLKKRCSCKSGFSQCKQLLGRVGIDFVQVLDQIVLNYNKTKHSTIQEVPSYIHFCFDSQQECLQCREQTHKHLQSIDKRTNTTACNHFTLYQIGDAVQVVAYLDSDMS